MRKKLSNLINSKFLRLFIGISLIYIIATQVDYRQFRGILEKGNYQYLSLGIACFLLSNLMEIIRFHLIAGNFSGRIYHTAKIFFLSLFVANFLPSSLGGDLYRIFYIGQKSKFQIAFSLITIERIIGLASLMAMAVIALALDFNSIKEIYLTSNLSLQLKEYQIYVIVIALILLFCTFILIRYRFIPLYKKLLVYAKEVSEILQNRRRFTLRWTIILSLLFHALRTVGFYFWIVFVGEQIQLVHIQIITAVLAITSLLPISIGALGVAEGTLAIGFVAFGMTESQAILIAFLNRLIKWLPALLGGYYFIAQKTSPEHN